MLLQRDILPTPIAVAQSFVENFGEIAKHFVASGFRVIASIVIAVVLAVPAGLGMGQIPRLESHLLAAGLPHLSHSQDRVLPDHSAVSRPHGSRQDFDHRADFVLSDPGAGAR